MSISDKMINTVYGVFSNESRRRLELTYDYENSAIQSFYKIGQLIGAQCLFDIGANIGVYSVFCSSIDTLEEVNSFEPAPLAYKQLQENTKNINKSEIHNNYNIAISDTKYDAYINIISPLSGLNYITSEPSSKENNSVKVDFLDNFVNHKNKICLIKIDIEGHEYQAVRGMAQLIKNNACYLQVESLTGENRDKLFRELERNEMRHIFSFRDDHIFISSELERYEKDIFSIISEAISFDLRDLMHLRLEKRLLNKTLKKLQSDFNYSTDPLFLYNNENPFKE